MRSTKNRSTKKWQIKKSNALKAAYTSSISLKLTTPEMLAPSSVFSYNNQNVIVKKL